MRSIATLAFVGFSVVAIAAPKDPNIVVPDTSVAYPQDHGLRAHTNHLIYVGPVEDLPPVEDQPFMMAALHGPMALQNASTSAYTPAQIRSAYSVSSNGSGAIAIIDAYHFASSLNDFNVFSRQYGLPVETSTNALASTNKVFQVVYASGSKPRNDGGWGQEAALDIEWAHAMAPSAKIYLVEATSNSFANLFAAIDYVAQKLPDVKQVSMSWGGSEFSSETSYDSRFSGGKVWFTSTGDSGAARDYPAESPNVVAVGGTTLKLNVSGGRLSESAWSSGGGGISGYEARPSFQSIVSTIVGSKRGNPDVSADADPYTGCWVYDSTRYQGYVGWMVFGGTSLSSPMVAGIVNGSTSTATSSSAENARIYSHLSSNGTVVDGNFHDITAGSNGHAAVAGWDLATGVGSPNGAGGF